MKHCDDLLRTELLWDENLKGATFLKRQNPWKSGIFESASVSGCRMMRRKVFFQKKCSDPENEGLLKRAVFHILNKFSTICGWKRWGVARCFGCFTWNICEMRVVRKLLVFVEGRFRCGWLFECGAECCRWFWSGEKFAYCACLCRDKLFSAKNVSFFWESVSKWMCTNCKWVHQIISALVGDAKWIVCEVSDKFSCGVAFWKRVFCFGLCFTWNIFLY